jgi:hypothetical protein
MTTTSHFMNLNKPCDEAAAWAMHTLKQHGLQSLKTFDLHASHIGYADCPCPHHGTEQCNCQMVVLLVYQGNQPPASLVLHGSDETSWFYLVNTPHQPNEQSLDEIIKEMLSTSVNTFA